MFEILIFIILTITLECGIGIIYGVGIGFEPMTVYIAAITINFLTTIGVVLLIDRLLNWKKGVKNWLERRLSRGQRLIDKYGIYGIIMGVLVLSPMQLAIVGRLVGIKPAKLCFALFFAIIIVATVYLGVAIGIFKFLLP